MSIFERLVSMYCIVFSVSYHVLLAPVLSILILLHVLFAFYELIAPFLHLHKYRNTAFPKHLHRQPTPTLNTQGKMPCNPLVGPPTCKLVGDKSIFFGQLPLGSGFQSRSTHGIDPAANPRRRTEFPSHDDSHNVSSLVDDIANSYSTFRCDQNESRRPLSSTCTDIETAGSC